MKGALLIVAVFATGGCQETASHAFRITSIGFVDYSLHFIMDDEAYAQYAQRMRIPLHELPVVSIAASYHGTATVVDRPGEHGVQVEIRGLTPSQTARLLRTLWVQTVASQAEGGFPAFTSESWTSWVEVTSRTGLWTVSRTVRVMLPPIAPEAAHYFSMPVSITVPGRITETNGLVETSNTSQRGSAAAPDGLWVIYSTPNWAARSAAGLLAVLVLAAAAGRMRTRKARLRGGEARGA